MKYHFKIHKEGDKYWAQGIELDTCFTQADSLKGLHKNMQEALNLYIEEPADSTYLAPLPDESIKLSKNNVVEVEVDPFIAFSFLVRRCRIMHGITQQEAANRMGFAKVYSYQRLESKKCNPSLRIIYKIKKTFPEFSLDIAL
jgi:DNA-binding XRE family transcriptional regulator